MGGVPNSREAAISGFRCRRDEVHPERIGLERWIEEPAIIVEHAILNRIRQLVWVCRQTKRIIGLAGVLVIADEVEASHASIDVETRDAQSVIVIPEIACRYVVVIHELVRESTRTGPLRTDDIWAFCRRARIVEEFGITVILEIGVPAMQVDDDGNPVSSDCPARIAWQAVAPMKGRVYRQKMFDDATEIVLPVDDRSLCPAALRLLCTSNVFPGHVYTPPWP